MHADGRGHGAPPAAPGDSDSGSLPALDRDRGATTAQGDARAGATARHEERVVLVIEDEPNITEAIRFILSRDGWHVLTHAEGHDALARIEAIGPQLVILDVMLPGRNGMDILRAMRDKAHLADLPVIMLTARGQSSDREAALKNGASLYMSKPFSNADLLAAARRLTGT